MSQDNNITYKSEETNDSEDFNLSILLENIKRNKIIISFFTSLTFLLSIIYLILKSPVYEGRFQILLNPKSNSTRKALQSAKNSILQSNPELSYIFGTFESTPLTILTEVQVLQSPSVLMPIFDRFKEQKLSKGIDLRYLNFYDWRDNSLKIERNNRTSILNVSYFDKDEDMVIEIILDISNTLQNYSIMDRTKYIEKRLKLLNNQINIYEKQFENSYEKALTFALENDILEPNFNFGEEERYKINLYENGRLTFADRKRFFNEMNNYFMTIKNNEDKLLSFSKIIPNKYSEKITALEKSYTLSKSDFKDSDILLIKNRKEREKYINLLKVSIAEYLEKEIKENEFKYNASIRPKEIFVKYEQLKRQSDRDKKTLNNLEIERRAILLEKNRDEKPWEIITYPYVKTINPDTNKILILGILSGFLFGYIFSYFKDLKSSKIFFKEEIRKLLKNKELLFLSKEKLSIWKELLNLVFSNLKDYSREEDISLIKLGEIDQNNLKILKEIIQTKFPKIKVKIFNKILDCKESKNKLFISQLSRITKKEIAIFEEQRFLLKLERIDWILFDS